MELKPTGLSAWKSAVPAIGASRGRAPVGWALAILLMLFGTTACGSLWGWGDNVNGQLGFGDTTNRPLPTQLGSANWLSVSTSQSHSVAVRADGSLWAWGKNFYGELGVGDTLDRTAPVQIGTATNWRSVSAGDEFTLAVRSDDTLWWWGYDGEGIRGAGIKDFNPHPTPIAIGASVTSVSAAPSFALKIDTDGSLWAWGSNPSGALGVGDTTERLGFTPLAGKWNSISAGGAFTTGVRSDGTLWSWGDNFFGELGVGDTANRLSPVQVGTASSWRSVSAGYNHAVSIRADGTLWAWGANESGELGLGDTAKRVTPTRVGAASNWTAISAGTGYTMALRGDGTLWSWGSTYAGQLGNGSTGTGTDTYYQPTQVGSAANWTAVTAGWGRSYGLRVSPPAHGPRVVAIEVNQSLQDWSDSVPLIVGKPTVVRVFLSSDVAVSAGATSWKLRGTSPTTGAALGADISAVNGATFTPGATPESEANRADVNGGSLNFVLPWSSGDANNQLQLSVVDSSGNRVACDDQTHRSGCGIRVTLVAGPHPRIALVPIHIFFEDPSAPGVVHDFPPTADPQEYVRRIKDAFPTSQVDAISVAELEVGIGPDSSHLLQICEQRVAGCGSSIGFHYYPQTTLGPNHSVTFLFGDPNQTDTIYRLLQDVRDSLPTAEQNRAIAGLVPYFDPVRSASGAASSPYLWAFTTDDPFNAFAGDNWVAWRNEIVHEFSHTIGFEHPQTWTTGQPLCSMTPDSTTQAKADTATTIVHASDYQARPPKNPPGTRYIWKFSPFSFGDVYGGNNSPTSTAPAFQIGPRASAGRSAEPVWGMNTRAFLAGDYVHAVVDPYQNFDLMSYCYGLNTMPVATTHVNQGSWQWIARYEYENLITNPSSFLPH